MAFNIYKGIDKKKDFRKKPLIFIDLETTGVDMEKHEITEIACLVVDPETLKIKKRFERKVMPERLGTADPKALKMTGFSKKVWQKQAKPLEKVLQDLNKLAPGGMFIGWNISFDRPFLEKAVREKGVELNYDYHWLEVETLAYKELFPQKKPRDFRLTSVCKTLGISRGKKHTAMADVKATLEVYRHLRKRRKLTKV